MEKELIIKSSEAMIELGNKLGLLLKPNTVITLEGDLGAGKTTFTKGVARGIGVKGIVNSPTLTILKIYEGDMTLYHMDVYRVDNEDFELSEYFEEGGVCVIEWANNISDLLPNERIDIQINDLGENQRNVQIKSIGKIYDEIVKELYENFIY